MTTISHYAGRQQQDSVEVPDTLDDVDATRAVSTCRTGLVVIGRNEGERLRVCLKSVAKIGIRLVYVDSGSTDHSVAIARELGANVIELDPFAPFTAARARNAGIKYLLRDCPDLDIVQFVDGDCEIRDSWLARGQECLRERPDVAVACGRVRERCRGDSIYRRLCDLEWKMPVGEAEYCGGIAMMRVEALKQVGGFDPTLIAGEDTEVGVRLRLQGWKILNLDTEMVIHDSAITRIGQWWSRSVRAGHAFAQVSTMHGSSLFPCFVRKSRSAWFWGCVLPVVIAGLAWSVHGACLLLLIAYLLLGARSYRTMRRRGETRYDAMIYAVHCVAAKVPQSLGQTKFYFNHLRGTQSKIIEHKHANNQEGRGQGSNYDLGRTR